MIKKPNNKVPFDRVLIDIIESGLEKRTTDVESLALILSKIIKVDHPIISTKIIELISSYSISGNVPRNNPLPIDSDSQLEMVTVVAPGEEKNRPALSADLNEKIHNFIEERKNINLLLENNLKPSTSLLLIGQPGTGKTMLARYLASELNKNLVILDLSSSISSLMGKTGQNLKKVLQYARQSSAVLLLDEFDAIAKKRDDSTDLGEIKRIVNVLLMELETWPVSSVVIATSNHPELLDRAIWRRFDHVLELPLPQKEERVLILQRYLSDFISERDLSNVTEKLGELLDKKSGADIQKFSENVKRRVVLKKENIFLACLHELETGPMDKKGRGRFCALAKQLLGSKVTIRELSEMTGLSVAGVQHHISKAKL